MAGIEPSADFFDHIAIDYIDDLVRQRRPRVYLCVTRVVDIINVGVMAFVGNCETAVKIYSRSADNQRAEPLRAAE